MSLMFMNPKYNYCVVSLSKFAKSKTTKDDFHPPYLHYLCSFVPLMQFSCVILSWRMSKCSSGDALNSQKNRSRVEKDPTDTLSNYKTILKVSFVLIESVFWCMSDVWCVSSLVSVCKRDYLFDAVVPGTAEGDQSSAWRAQERNPEA